MLVKLDKEDFVISVEREIMPTQTQICKGPIHRKRGSGTPLPLSAFSVNKYHPDQLTKTCTDCLKLSGRRPMESTKVELRKIQAIESLRTTASEISAGLDGGMQYKWRVVHLNPVESIVYAKNYIDAGSQVQGPIISVERLD